MDPHPQSLKPNNRKDYRMQVPKFFSHNKVIYKDQSMKKLGLASGNFFFQGGGGKRVFWQAQGPGDVFNRQTLVSKDGGGGEEQPHARRPLRYTFNY